MAQTRSFATIGTSLRNALLSSTGPYQWNAPPSPSDPPYEMPSLLHWTLLKECLFLLHWTLPKECPPSSIGPSLWNVLHWTILMECPPSSIGPSLCNALSSSTGSSPYGMPSLLHWTILNYGMHSLLHRTLPMECPSLLHWTIPKECPPSSIGPSRRNALLSSLGFSLCMECPTLLST